MKVAMLYNSMLNTLAAVGSMSIALLVAVATVAALV
jgi:hypothetical protein